MALKTRGAWKTIERQWATLLGGKRVPITGRQRGDAPDIDHPTLSIEVKAGKTISTRLFDGMEQAKASIRGDQLPILCVTQSRIGNQGNINWVMMESDVFVEIATKAGLLDETIRHGTITVSKPGEPYGSLYLK